VRTQLLRGHLAAVVSFGMALVPVARKPHTELPANLRDAVLDATHTLTLED